MEKGFSACPKSVDKVGGVIPSFSPDIICETVLFQFSLSSRSIAP